MDIDSGKTLFVGSIQMDTVEENKELIRRLKRSKIKYWEET